MRRMLACAGMVLALGATARGQAVDFSHEVAPVLRARCVRCHGDGASKGEFSIDTRESFVKSKAVVPGKAGESELFERLASDDPEFRMPPEGKRVTAAEAARLRAWVDQGLPWEAGFSFKGRAYVAPLALKEVVLPPARGGREHPVDRIIDAYQAAKGVPTPEPVDDAAFARRLFLDVIGLLPPPGELKAFLAEGPSSGKRARLARRALDDRRAYAEHWLSFWNDLLRNDYKGTGYIDGGRKPITAWLYGGLLENKSYDVFTRELIDPTPESEGFIKGIKWRGRVNASQVPEVQFAQNVGQVFLGVNLKCASCHDSFIDKWKLDDAYGLAAVTAESPLEVARCDVPTGRRAVPKFLWPELGSIDPGLSREGRLKRLAGLTTARENGRFARTIVNRVWERLFGRGIVHPVDVMANEPWSEDLLDHLAGYLVANGHDLKGLIAHVTTSEAYGARPALASEAEAPGGSGGYVFRGPEVKRLTAEAFVDAVWMVTGAGAQPGSGVEGGPEAVAPEHRFVRAAVVPADALMRSLGRPNREQVVTTREDVLTTLQALELSNGGELTGAAAVGGARLLKEHAGASAAALVEFVYLQALGRRPGGEELATACGLVGRPATAEGLADLLWAVFMLPEFQLVR